MCLLGKDVAAKRRPAEGGAAAVGGRSSVRLCYGCPGQHLVYANLFERTNHSTTGTSGSCPSDQDSSCEWRYCRVGSSSPPTATPHR